MPRIIALLLVGIACASCSTPESVQRGGISDWTVEFSEEGKPTKVRILDGKEKADISFKVDLETGKAEYRASDVKAFDAIRFAAELGAIQANEQGQTLREVAPGAISEIVALARAYLTTP